MNSKQCGLVSDEALVWLEKQKPCVQQLWFECMRAEKTGLVFGALHSALSKNTFGLAKRTLQNVLFEFEPIWKRSESGRYVIEGWQVRNLNGTGRQKSP